MIKLINELGETKTFNNIAELLMLMYDKDIKVNTHNFIINNEEYEFEDLTEFTEVFYNQDFTIEFVEKEEQITKKYNEHIDSLNKKELADIDAGQLEQQAIKPNYYKLNIKGVDCDVNDILRALQSNHKDASKMYFNFVSNALEYIIRAYNKNGVEDIKKAITELQFAINELKEEENE